jgi:O-antigen ligase
MVRRGDSRRFEIWSPYIDYSSQRPLLGYGMIEGLSEGMAFTSKDGTVIPHAHNLILSAQVRGGVLATGAMIVMLFGGLYYSARYAKLTGGRAPLAIMTTLVVSGIFEYDTFIRNCPSWQIVSFWFPVGICVGSELCVRERAPLAASATPHPSSA